MGLRCGPGEARALESGDEAGDGCLRAADSVASVRMMTLRGIDVQFLDTLGMSVGPTGFASATSESRGLSLAAGQRGKSAYLRACADLEGGKLSLQAVIACA